MVPQIFNCFENLGYLAKNIGQTLKLMIGFVKYIRLDQELFCRMKSMEEQKPSSKNFKFGISFRKLFRAKGYRSLIVEIDNLFQN